MNFKDTKLLLCDYETAQYMHLFLIISLKKCLDAELNGQKKVTGTKGFWSRIPKSLPTGCISVPTNSVWMTQSHTNTKEHHFCQRDTRETAPYFVSQ